MSAFENEFRLAQQLGLPIFVYIKGKASQDKRRDKRLQKIIKEIKHPGEGYIYRRFTSIEELKRLIQSSLIEFLRERGIISKKIEAFEEEVCKEATLKDIDEDRVEWFLQIAKEKRGFSIPVSQRSSLKDILIHLNLIKENKLTNAAVLLFGKDPSKFFHQAEIKCLHLPGVEICKPFLSYKIYNQNLFEQIDKAISFVLDAIRQSVIQQEHTPQFYRPFEIPVFAIQEAIVNAVAHRNYNNTAGVQVLVFVDRVEVWSPGRLPPALTVEDLKKPHTSYPTNPLIARILFLANYIQKAGTGTLEMVKQCREHGIPEPQFVTIRDVEFRTILPRDIYTISFLKQAGLNERQIQAVKIVKEKGAISLSDLQNIYKNITRKTLYRDLQTLVNKGILKARGDKRGRKYSF